MKYDIFISYCGIDAIVAKQIAYKLEKFGLNCFLDVDNIQLGNNYASTIQTIVLKTKYVVFIYGENSENSVYQRRELDFALDSGKKVISFFANSSNDGVINLILKKKTECCNSIDEVCENIRRGIIEVLSSPSYAPEHISSSLKNKHLNKRSILLGVIAIIGVCIFLMFMNTGAEIQMCEATPDLIDNNKDSINEADILNRDTVLTLVNDYEDCESSSQLHNSKHPIWCTNSFVFALVGILIGFLLAFILRSCRKRKNVKLCSDVNVSVYIDGYPVAKINAGDVFTTCLDRGEYLIDFHADNKGHNRIIKKIVDKKSHVIFSEFLNKEEVKFKCFIAGSLALNVERNALIAEVSKMHNKWESEQFRISSYTFEDFNRDVVPGGQQKLYDTFIANEANWCVFIISNGIGEKTLNEYRVAMNSLLTNGHPKILFLASTESTKDEALAAIKKEIMDANQYWNTCNNIEHMQKIFRECLEWDVTLLSKSKK